MGYVGEKKREYAREWIRARRQSWLSENGPCKKCGSSENLEVDHIDPKTKIHHAIWSWSEKRRLEELSKCQVLCRKCHQEKTFIDMGYKLHGTASKYDSGCRCVECTIAVRERIYRRRMRLWGSKSSKPPKESAVI